MDNGLEVSRESREYLVEVYVSGLDAEELERVAARAARAAEEVARQGRPVRYLRSIFVPEEQTCFHVYAASSAVEVREASKRSGISPERVVAAIQTEASNHAAVRAPNNKEER